MIQGDTKMTLQEFTTKYNFHDSLLENITYNAESSELILLIDFCYWMQENYNNEEPETGMISVIFKNVFDFSGLEGECDDYSILHIKLIGGKINIGVLDDFNDEYYTITFYADEVIINLNQD